MFATHSESLVADTSLVYWILFEVSGVNLGLQYLLHILSINNASIIIVADAFRGGGITPIAVMFHMS